MYAKIFESMYDGSLATVGPWEALVTFQQMLVLADRWGTVDMTPEAISRRTTIPLAIIRKGIDALEQPDEQSRDPNLDGRRIRRLAEHRDWGWAIVNHAKYRAIRSSEDRREYQRKWMADKRAATPESGNGAREVGEWQPGERDLQWATKNGYSFDDAKRAYNEMRDWALAHGHRRKDWPAQWRNWMRKNRNTR